jgi:hypothetical protein
MAHTRDGVAHPRHLLRLIELELIGRERRVVERRIRQARFPAVKSFDTFDFTAIASLNKNVRSRTARCEYIQHRENMGTPLHPSSRYRGAFGPYVVGRGRYVALQMAEVAILKFLFADILRGIAELRPPHHPTSA